MFNLVKKYTKPANYHANHLKKIKYGTNEPPSRSHPGFSSQLMVPSHFRQHHATHAEWPNAFGFRFSIFTGGDVSYWCLSIFRGRCVFSIRFRVSNEFLETTRSSSKTLSSKTLTAALLLAQRRGATDDGSDAPRVGSSELKELTKLVGLCWIMLLAGGFNPFEKHESEFRIFPK